VDSVVKGVVEDIANQDWDALRMKRYPVRVPLFRDADLSCDGSDGAARVGARSARRGLAANSALRARPRGSCARELSRLGSVVWAV
jgi:hypothetical protein